MSQIIEHFFIPSVPSEPSSEIITAASKQFFNKHNTLLFIRNGEATISSGGQTQPVKAGTFLFFKHTSFVEFLGSHQTLELLRFNIDSPLVHDFLQVSGHLFQPAKERQAMVAVTGSADILSYMATLDNKLLTSKADPLLQKVKCLELLGVVYNVYPSFMGQLLLHRPLHWPEIICTVEENITNTLTLSELATMTGRSLSSFKRDFYAIYQTTPSRWIRERRLERSHHLIVASSLPIKAICYQLGFESTAHFSRLFKRHFGCCPSDLKGAMTT